MALGLLRFTNEDGGTADFVYPGPAIDMQSPASAGAVDGTTYLYYAQSFDMAEWEIGSGPYTESSGTFGRGTIIANSDGDTSKISFATPPQIMVFDTFTGFAAASDVAANTAAINKLADNQFARVSLITTNQTGIVDASFNVVNFNNVNFDPSGIWDNTNKRLQPTIAGYYRFGFGLNLGASTNMSQNVAALFKNGAPASYGLNSILATTFAGSTGGDVLHMNGTTDYVDLRGYISGGTSKFFQADDQLTFMNIDLVKAD